nr:fructose-bisphosphate aldolase [Candidatus Bathyarchaeota archaeon]
MVEVDGKQARLCRITRRERAVIIPMDHGVTNGPIKGLTNMDEIVGKVVEGGATAVLLHKGIIKHLCRPPECGIIMHLSASTVLGPDPNWKVRVASVEEAIRLGADAVSVHVNVGSEREPQMLEKLGYVADMCDEWRVPLIAMMYPRGKNIDSLSPDAIAHASRIGAELGADIVKTPYTGSPETFRRVVEGCPAPIVIAGGPKAETDLDVLRMVRGAMDAGAIGVAMGRNAFQHENPAAIVKAVAEIVLNDAEVEEAAEKAGVKI